jgi:hypothetical protein
MQVYQWPCIYIKLHGIEQFGIFDVKKVTYVIQLKLNFNWANKLSLNVWVKCK